MIRADVPFNWISSLIFYTGNEATPEGNRAVMLTDQLHPVQAGRQILPKKYKILISVVFGIFMVILDTTVVNVAFQTLRDEFGATLNDSQWIISIYVLALEISTPLSAFLATRYGMKRIYLAGLSIFIVGSFLSGISPTPSVS